MGTHALRFVKPLSEDDRVWLHEVWKTHPLHVVRSRAHAILLSDKRRAAFELAVIFDVSVDTIRNWFEHWEERGRDGLEDEPRSGRPPKLDESGQELLKTLIEEHPQEPRVVQRELAAKTGESLSRSTLRRWTRRLGFKWKRMRRSLKKHRDSQRFALAMEELAELRAMSDVSVVFFDEASFSLSGTCGYAWQQRGTRLEIPLSGGPRRAIQVLGFQTAEGKVQTYIHNGMVKGTTVVEAIDDYCRTVQGTTVLVLDNASPHTCKLMKEREPQWQSRGLILYYLPPYSPELNSIEHLWQKLKHQLLPATAWENLTTLREMLLNALNSLGFTKTLEPVPAN